MFLCYEKVKIIKVEGKTETLDEELEISSTFY